MSRWFKVTLVLMVLFVVRMAFKANMGGPSDLQEEFSSSELYQLYHADRDQIEDDYGGRRVTITGYVTEILGEDRPNCLMLSSKGFSGDQTTLVQCYLTDRRSYRWEDFGVGQQAFLDGRIMKEQDQDWVKMDYCKVLVY